MEKRLLTEVQIAEVEKFAKSYLAQNEWLNGSFGKAIQWALWELHFDVWVEIDISPNKHVIKGLANRDDTLIPKFYQILRGEAGESTSVIDKISN